MSDETTNVITIVSALIGAIIGSIGATFTSHFLSNRAERQRIHSNIVQRYLIQLQFSLELLSSRFHNFRMRRRIMTEDIYGWMNKGAILHDLGEYTEAIRCFDTALNIGRDPSALYYRACSNSKLGNVEDGLADLEEATESDEKYIRLAKYEKNFESIRMDERFKAILNIT